MTHPARADSGGVLTWICRTGPVGRGGRLTNDQEAVLARVVEIAAIPPGVEDGIHYLLDTAHVRTIRDEDLYAGVW